MFFCPYIFLITSVKCWFSILNIVLERLSLLPRNLGISQPLSCLTGVSHESLSNTQPDLLSWKPFVWCYSSGLYYVCYLQLLFYLLCFQPVFPATSLQGFVMMRLCDFQLAAHLPSFLLSPLQSDDMVILLLRLLLANGGLMPAIAYCSYLILLLS